MILDVRIVFPMQSFFSKLGVKDLTMTGVIVKSRDKRKRRYPAHLGGPQCLNLCMRSPTFVPKGMRSKGKLTQKFLEWGGSLFLTFIPLSWYTVMSQGIYNSMQIR